MPSRLQLLSERVVEPETAPRAPMPSVSPTPPTSEEKPARVILAITLLTLKLLSERTIALAGAIFPLIILGAGFYLWLKVLSEPSVLQLIGLGLFAAFALLMLLVRKV